MTVRILFVPPFFCILEAPSPSGFEHVYYLFSLVAGYFIGSLPTAYLLVKWKARSDIRSAGSGNVGAMNAYDVTGSRTLGAAVMVIDMLKGVCAVTVALGFCGGENRCAGLAGIAAMVGHNYPVWLGFKGGRVLATGAGVMLMFGWLTIVIWCALWMVHYLIFKNIHMANIIASVVSPFVLLIIPRDVINATSFAAGEDFYPLTISVFVLILIKHGDYLRQVFQSSTLM